MTDEEFQIVTAILADLPSGAIFTRDEILNASRKHASGRVHHIGKFLFPTFILKLGNTETFIHREDARRPLAYRGLRDPNGDGIICSDPLPPNFV